MFSAKGKSNSSRYAPLALHDNGRGSSVTLEKRSSTEEDEDDDHSAPLLEASETLPALAPSKPSQLPRLIFYLSFAVALLSVANVALLPATLSKYQYYPFSDSELEALPYGDARLGLDRAAKMLPPPKVYHHAWPDRILTEGKDSTIMRFPVPSAGVNACAIFWKLPPENSVRVKDLATKGDITEVEVWQVIAPSPTLAPVASSMDELDYDTLSYSALPVRGELLGVLDLTAQTNSTTVEFACPSDAGSLVVEMRCQRVACHLSQTVHRLAILQHWNIPVGSRVLELGCGQGDCTTVIASAVGEEGAVVVVDPAELDYGAPYTLGQAQSHISQGLLGSRVTWVQQPPLDYLSSLSSTSESKTFDATVLAHCMWYFASPSVIISTFRALKQHSKRLLLAEWSLVATDPSAQPHVLAALTQAALECRKKDSESNVRTVLGPKRLTELALAAGWQLETKALVQCGEDLLDGQWEVGACLSSDFKREVEEHVSNERERAVVLASRDACEASLKGVQGGLKGVRSMDVWVAGFK
ncbi:SAM-dependent methyltransferase [Colletotrichum asianum]